MSKQVIVSGVSFNLDTLPNKCPFCHDTITPDIIVGYKNKDEIEVFLSCSSLRCNKTFIGYYQIITGSRNTTYLNRTTKGNIIARNFNTVISDISSSFVEIYNQAYFAEQEGLMEICGVGYRKALEFLIKDYAVRNFPDNENQIKAAGLAAVISTYVDDSKVKSVATRAVWLGNDETHYVRKWEGKDLSDLKKLIDLTIHWIEAEALSRSFSEEMPG